MRELHGELAAAPGRSQRHRPDGLVVIEGREAAVEVEVDGIGTLWNPVVAR